MTQFEEEIWQPLIQAYRSGNAELFQLKFRNIYYIHEKIELWVLLKYNCSKATAFDCVHESYLVLLNNIYLNKEKQFTSEKELFGYLTRIAYNKAIELIYRVPKCSEINDSIDIEYIPKFIDQLSGNVFIDVYEGKKDVEAFIKKERDCFRLLELKIIKNYSYKEILNLKEYSHYKEDALRKKVSRCLKKYKIFLNR